MSTRHYSWAWQQAVGRHAHHVLLCLVEHADKDTGQCFPSVKMMADETGWSQATVQRALVELEQVGVIEREPRYRPNGSQTSDLITLVCLEIGGSLTDTPHPDWTALVPRPGLPQLLGGSLTATGGVSHSDPQEEPTTEPSTEPTTTDSSPRFDDVEKRNAHASEPGDVRALVAAAKAKIEAKRHGTARQPEPDDQPAPDTAAVAVSAPSAPTRGGPTPTARRRRPGSSSAAVPKGTATLPRAPGGRPR